MEVPVKTIAAALMLALLVGAPPTSSWAQEDEVLSQLLRNVEYWKSRGREDKVAENWRKVLNADPAHAQALAELCVYEAQAGRKRVAQQYLSRLEAAHPEYPDLPRLRRIVSLSEDYRVLIEEARALVAAGKIPQAIAKYREAFGDHPPPAHLGVEFYSTLGGTEDGYEEARLGLKRLHEDHPSDDAISLAYAKHLTYREKHRREGIRLLRKLSKSSQLRNQTRPAWKDSLLWLHARANDRPLFQAYLDEVDSDDSDIKKRLDDLRKATAPPPPKSPGEKAMDRGDIDDAETYYKKLLAGKPNNTEALRGLARIEMTRGHFELAREYLEKLKQIAPKKPRLWQDLEESVEFWMLMAEAETLRVQGRLAESEALLRRAMGVSSREAHHAEAALGNILIAQGEWAQARERFGAVLKKHPRNEAALRGMIRVLIELGQEGEAAQYSSRLAKLEDDPEVQRKIEHLRWLAAIERSAGKLLDALALLEEARSLCDELPENEAIVVWVLHDLVHVHLALGNAEQARWVLDELLQRDPDKLEVQLTRAHVLAEEGRVAEALDVADAIPTDGTHVGLATLQRELRVRKEILRLLELGKHGPVGEAYRGLNQLEQDVLDSPELLALLALAWSDLGDYRRAQEVMKRALSRSLQPSTTMRLQLGAILLRGERFEDLGELLDDLKRADSFSVREEADYNELVIAYNIRRADRAAGMDRHAQAYEHLFPLLERFPDDPRVQSALGRLFLEAGDHESAHAIFLRLLESNPEDNEALEGAIRAAIGAGHKDEARELVAAGLAAYPNSPRMHLIAGRCYLMLGNDFRAMDLLHKGLALAEEQEETAGADNAPFEGDEEQALDVEATQEEILRAAARRFGKPATATAVPRGTRTIRDELEDEIRSVRGRNSEQIGGGLNIRYRHGVSGLGQLVEFDVPVTFGLALGTAGMLRLTAEAVLIDAGELDVGNPAEGDLFGQVGRVDASADNPPWSQTRQGFALDLSYSYRGWWAHVGSTPLGFPLQTVLGGLGWNQTFGGFSVAIMGGRRLVRDSLVSMGGAVDPVTLEPWGGVTANGGRLEIAFEHGPMLYYGFGGFDWLHGTEVQTNRAGYGGAGLRWGFHEKSTWAFKTGLSLGAMGYAHNQRYFTWGHGGYFSPQFFFNGSLPLVIEGDNGRIVAHLEADIGINWFREDEVDFYPLEGWMQSARAPKVDEEGVPVAITYEEQRAVGLAVNFRGHLAYRISDRFVVGAEARAHYASDYEEYYGGIFLGFSFRPASTATVPVVPRFF